MKRTNSDALILAAACTAGILLPLAGEMPPEEAEPAPIEWED
jgi:hypothetical protein